MKATELIELAIKDGCISTLDFVEWSYREGRISALKESVERIARVTKEIVPEFQAKTIPDFLQDGFEPDSVTHFTSKDK